MQVQPFLQVYLTYEDQVLLIGRFGKWVPIGGHLVQKGIEPSSLDRIRNEVDFLKGEINAVASGVSYSLYGSEGELYLTKPYRGPSQGKQQKGNYGSVYFGIFGAQPPVVEGAFELFNLDRLRGIPENSLGHLVLENSGLALKTKELILHRF